MTTTADTTNGAQISLRDAMIYANSHANATVTISPSLAGQTITLGAGLPLVGQSTTIEGNGAILSGNNLYRGFLITGVASTPTGSAAISVSISNLTITNVVAHGGNGNSGGGGGLGAGGAVSSAPQPT